MKPYAELLRDPKWQKKRLEVMEAAGFACQECGDTKTTLNVHHVRYVRGRAPWEYELSELRCVCERCHAREHGKPTEPPRREQERVNSPLRAEWLAYEEDINRRITLGGDAATMDALLMEKLELRTEMQARLPAVWVSHRRADG